MIYRFVFGEISGAQFEQEFLSYFKTDTNQVASEEFDILDAIIGDVDNFVNDPALRAEVDGYDEAELRERVHPKYRRLFDAP